MDAPTLDPGILTVSSDYLASMTPGQKLRAISKSAAEAYASSGAADDPTKLQTLTDEYPAKAAAEEARADAEFKKTWDTMVDDVSSVANAIQAGAGDEFKYMIGTYYAWIQDAWIGAKKLWKWVFNSGEGYDQKWVDAAKSIVAEFLSWGVVPRPFYSPSDCAELGLGSSGCGDTSPMGYVKNLVSSRNAIKYLDEYTSPGQQDIFVRVMNSIWRANQYNVIVREGIGRLSLEPQLMWIQSAVSTDDTSHGGELSRLMAETIGFAAAFDAGAPIFLWERIVAAARAGWNGGVSDATVLYRIRRDHLYDGTDFSDGATLVSPDAGGVAAIAAYTEARREAAHALGDVGASLVPPKKGDAPPPTRAINANQDRTRALFSGKDTIAARDSTARKKTLVGYVLGVLGSGSLWYFGWPVYTIPVPLALGWLNGWYAKRRAANTVAGTGGGTVAGCGCHAKNAESAEKKIP